MFCSCDVFRALFLNSFVCWCFVYAACSYFEYVLSLHHHHYQHQQQQRLLLSFRKCFFVFFKFYFISSNVFYAFFFSFSGLFIFFYPLLLLPRHTPSSPVFFFFYMNWRTKFTGTQGTLLFRLSGSILALNCFGFGSGCSKLFNLFEH